MANPEQTPEEPVVVERRDPSSQNKFRRSIFSVPVTVTISIGQMRLSVSEILELQAESIVPLTSRIDDPVDLIIDNKVIARGELVEAGEGGLAVKITEIPEEASVEHG